MKLTIATAILLLSSVLSFAQVPHSDHVYIVAEENRSYEHQIGTPEMPYLNALVARYGLATQFYANEHGSLPNYFWVTSGQEVTTNDDWNRTYDVDNIVRRLRQAGKSYKSYAEGIPYPGFPELYYGSYLKRHAALPWYTDMGDSAAEMLKHVPMTQWSADVANGPLPNFAFITPDATNDMHDCPSGLSACLQRADNWLKTYLGPLLARPEFQPGGDGLLILWADEADIDDSDNRCSASVASGCGGRIVVALIGPKVKAGYQSTITYHHQSLLRTMLMALGLGGPFPAAAESAPDMGEFFIGEPDFALSATVATSTVSPGQAATFAIDVLPQQGAFNNSVSLSCAGLPAGASCTFTPNPLIPGAGPVNSTMTINTPAVVGSLAPGHTPRHMPIYASFLPVMGIAVLAAARRGRRKALNISATCLGLVLIVAAAQGCGGGGGAAKAVSSAATVSTIIVTGTSGSTAHTTNVTLTIR